MRDMLKVLIAPALLLSGCTEAPAPAPAVATTNDALTGDNGVSINGVSINGVSINGTSLNGVSINGVSINGVSINGVSINGVSINGVSINGVSINGVSINGTEFAGAQLSALLSNGEDLTLRIDSVAALTDDNADVTTYAVSYQTQDGWSPLCGTEDDGSPRLALAVPGVWNVQTGAWSDPGDKFSFACRHASVAKCVEFGYKSWLGYGDYQHACVRMLRADYCGDGTPHTVNGTPINLYDNAGIQADTESWPVDAEWTPDGALCVNHHRGTTEPSCYSEKYNEACGSFASGALLIDEFNGQ